MKRFALIGAAGYIAPRHMKAIKDLKQDLLVATDPNDSVGIIDSFFPQAAFFTEFERFQHQLELLRTESMPIDYVSICSPNYLHKPHMLFALRAGANAICEKPLVLSLDGLDSLQKAEQVTGRKINTILQLRLHPAIQKLKSEITAASGTSKYEVDLTYITSRGKWYLESWKADQRKSGGIAANIGVHFFDMLHFLFGDIQANIVHHRSALKSSGYLEYSKARVRWFLSIDSSDLPAHVTEAGQRTYRSITFDGSEIEFSGGFDDLHKKSYEHILDGNGFGVEQNRTAIEAVSYIRDADVHSLAGDYHPFLASIVR